MLRRYEEIKEELDDACADQDIDIDNATNRVLQVRASKYQGMFHTINYGTLGLQRKRQALASCRDSLDSISDALKK